MASHTDMHVARGKERKIGYKSVRRDVCWNVPGGK